MGICFENVGRSITPPAAGIGGGAPSAGTSAAEAKGGWTVRTAGADELAKVAGEEAVDERGLRRDDDLGKLVAKAFDPAAAAAALPDLAGLLPDKKVDWALDERRIGERVTYDIR